MSRAHTDDVKWLECGNPAYVCLESVVLDKSLLNVLPYLMEFQHAGMLEVYHNLLTKYCPKRGSIFSLQE